MANRTKLLMIGGFLGAGKTTAIAELAERLQARGQRVGIVTNDQAFNLVDTHALRARGLDVGEVPGACFCCKFDDLIDTAAALGESAQPDVILTEPVGSCTDLVATVIEPLRNLYGDRYDVGKLAVLCKPEHGAKILGGEGNAAAGSHGRAGGRPSLGWWVVDGFRGCWRAFGGLAWFFARRADSV
ncbi:MAG: GTP-binding protein, partial [Planctomycetota bacterium]